MSEGQTVAIVGGGPAGTSCAIALRHLALTSLRNIRVVLYEGKTFRGLAPHHNQCAGVLSPPIASILETRVGIPFPYHIVQRTIDRYVLHSDRQELALRDEGEPSRVVRRVQFDDYLIEKAREVGVEVVNSRVVDIERHESELLVYSDCGSRKVSAVVGAFGLDEGSCRIFERAMDYRQPKYLQSIVTKVHPKASFLSAMGNTIHAFLPGLPQIDFGAMTPKGNHITINVAGSVVDAQIMDRFLGLPAVRRLLPGPDQRDTELGAEDMQYFKGKFPVSLAKGFYGDGFAIIGDAAGLIRPFKGKGVTGGCSTGVGLAETVFSKGTSQAAFDDFFGHDPYCREIRSDMFYAGAVRWFASSSSNRGYIDAVISLARREPAMRRALFDSISAHQPYKSIVSETISPRIAVGAVVEFLKWRFARG